MEHHNIYPSWKQNEDGEWESPVAHPNDGGQYQWNEEEQRWAVADPDE
jgi:hypothetical protein